MSRQDKIQLGALGMGARLFSVRGPANNNTGTVYMVSLSIVGGGSRLYSGGVSVAFFSILVRPWDSLMIAIDRAIPIIGDPGRFSANDRLKSRCATLFVLLSDFLTLIAERFIRGTTPTTLKVPTQHDCAIGLRNRPWSNTEGSLESGKELG